MTEPARIVRIDTVAQLLRDQHGLAAYVGGWDPLNLEVVPPGGAPLRAVPVLWHPDGYSYADPATLRWGGIPEQPPVDPMAAPPPPADPAALVDPVVAMATECPDATEDELAAVLAAAVAALQ